MLHLSRVDYTLCSNYNILIKINQLMQDPGRKPVIIEFGALTPMHMTHQDPCRCLLTVCEATQKSSHRFDF